MASTPPAPLAQAIAKASTKYGVPADLLVGIWREESGGSYPNVAANSLGYGGLFGTKAWNAPVQTQADLAASIVAEGLRQSQGNIAEALSYYNSGKLVGGYTSVPGETSFGNVRAPTSVPGPTGSENTAPPRPGGDGTNQDVGLFTTIEGIPGDIWGAGSSILDAATGTAGALKGFFKAMIWLLDPKTWLRGAEISFGFILILFGLYYFGKAEGSADVDPVDLAKNPKQLVSGAGSGARKSAQRAKSGSLVGKASRTVLKASPTGRAAKVASKVQG